MLIDWFTVGAQALNFLILVWLLKRFLYQPILDAIDAREQRIATQLSQAEAQQAEARRERDAFQHKNAAFELARAALLTQATDAADAERQRLLAEARQAADALSRQRQAALRNEARTLNQAITRRTQQEVFAIVRKALADLATASLEERLAEVFIRRLGEMDGPARDCFALALKTATEPALLRSAFDLPEAQRAALQQALDAHFATVIPLRFETAPDLVGGIELAVNGQKLAWSIAGYLAALEKSVGEWLQAEAPPEAKPEAPPATTQHP